MAVGDTTGEPLDTSVEGRLGALVLRSTLDEGNEPGESVGVLPLG
jgi:hypothetical protein